MHQRTRTAVLAACGGITALLLAACEVEQTEEAEMPEIDVEGGNLPEYEVETPDVDVRTEERTVEVPVLDVEPADTRDETRDETE